MISAMPTQALSMFGVPRNDINMLIDIFGPLLPIHEPEPQYVLRWAFNVLPWTSIHPILRTWVDESFTWAESNDQWLQLAVVGCLCDEPDEDKLGQTLDTLFNYLRRETRRHNVRDVGLARAMHDPEYPKHLKHWSGACAVVRAALCREEDEDDMSNISRYAGVWALQTAPESGRELVANRYCRTAVDAVIAFVRSWAPPALEKN
jgi:hypothetical protein